MTSEACEKLLQWADDGIELSSADIRKFVAEHRQLLDQLSAYKAKPKQKKKDRTIKRDIVIGTVLITAVSYALGAFTFYLL